MKNEDNIYEVFLNTLDEDLRGMCEKNVKAEKPFPYPYCGEENVERLAKALVGVLEKHSPDIPGLVPEQYRDDVHEARELLAAAALALLSLYFPQRDNCMRCMAILISLFRHGSNPRFKSSGVLMFEQVSTGMKYSSEKGDAFRLALCEASTTKAQRPRASRWIAWIYGGRRRCRHVFRTLPRDSATRIRCEFAFQLRAMCQTPV